MNANYRIVFAIAALVAMNCEAAGWHLTIGPAWRARVKTEVQGALPPVPASVDDLSARVDFSSLTLGAGVVFRF